MTGFLPVDKFMHVCAVCTSKIAFTGLHSIRYADWHWLDESENSLPSNWFFSICASYVEVVEKLKWSYASSHMHFFLWFCFTTFVVAAAVATHHTFAVGFAAAAAVFERLISTFRSHTALVNPSTEHANRIYALNILRNRILTHFLLDLVFCAAASQWTGAATEKCTFIINWNLMIYLGLR